MTRYGQVAWRLHATDSRQLPADNRMTVAARTGDPACRRALATVERLRYSHRTTGRCELQHRSTGCARLRPNFAVVQTDGFVTVPAEAVHVPRQAAPGWRRGQGTRQVLAANDPRDRRYARPWGVTYGQIAASLPLSDLLWPAPTSIGRCPARRNIKLAAPTALMCPSDTQSTNLFLALAMDGEARSPFPFGSVTGLSAFSGSRRRRNQNGDDSRQTPEQKQDTGCNSMRSPRDGDE